MLPPLQQAALWGAFFFTIYDLYMYFVIGLNSIDAATEAFYAAILFAAVYYLTSVVILKKKIAAAGARRGKGPGKGQRKE
jgi:hypothetical protein